MFGFISICVVDGCLIGDRCFLNFVKGLDISILIGWFVLFVIGEFIMSLFVEVKILENYGLGMK